MLGASFDTVDEIAAFAAKHDFPFDLLSDTDRSLGVAYGAADGPKDRYARRISYLIGPGGTIAAAYDQVDPASHPRQVLEDFDRLTKEA